MKIAHISDLHIDMNYKQANLLNTKRLFDYLTDEKFDHIIITGDITENSEATAFELARKLFLKHGFMNHDKLTLVVGNHDIYGGVHLAEDVLNYPSKCRNTNYKRQIEQFEYYFSESFKNCTRLIDGSLFPFVKNLDELMFIGMNSIAEYSVIKNPFASNGKISKAQLNSLDTLDEISGYSSRKRIMLTHHHFCKDSADLSVTAESGKLWTAIERQTMKLRDKKRILNSLKSNAIDLVLHGHLHETNEYMRKGIRFINAGGSAIPGKNGLLSFNEVNITKDNIYRREVNVVSPLAEEMSYNRLQVRSITPKTALTEDICLN